MRSSYHLSPLAFTGSLVLAAIIVAVANLPILSLGAAVVA
jgi:hypothetical protein